MSEAVADRRYHETNSAYALPNDGREHKRLEDQSNAINKMMSNKPFHTPIVSPARMVDVGCGTGSMTVRLAQQYPEAKVYGVDLSRVPPVHEQPENVDYILGSFNELVGLDERLRENTADYVFGRLLVVGVTDWPQFTRSCWDLLQPGGWLELQDYNYHFYDKNDNRVDNDWNWLRVLHTAANAKNLDLLCGHKFHDWMQEAGFEDISEKDYMWTMSDKHWGEHPDSDDIGKYSVQQLRFTMAEMLKKMCEQTSVVQDAGELEALRQETLDVLRMDEGGHAKFSVVWGRKPAAS